MTGPRAHVAGAGALLAALVFAALVPAAAQDAGTPAIDPAARAALSVLEDRYTPDSEAVVRALAARLRGLADRPGGGLSVAFTDPAPIEAAAPALRADPPLAVDGFAITAYAADPARPTRHALHGLLSFTDRFQRRLSVTFGADYEVADDLVTVGAVSVAPYFPPVPAVVMLFVPASRVAADFWTRHAGLDDLLAFAAENAVSFALPWAVPRVPEDHYAMAFFYEQLPRAARVDLLVADEPEGLTGERRSTVVLREGGWQVAIARVHLAFAEQATVYFKALYWPSDDVSGPEGAVRIAEVFSNRIPDLAARPRPAVEAPEPAPAPAVAAPAAPPAPEATPAAAAADSLEQRLERLRQLYQRELISREEYDAKRQALLDQL